MMFHFNLKIEKGLSAVAVPAGESAKSQYAESPQGGG